MNMEQNELEEILPHLTAEERSEAKELLDRYLELAREICKSRKRGPIPRLTEDRSNPTIQGKVEQNNQ